MEMMRDILSVRQKSGSQNGFVLRDLRAMKKGHHYLPALSIPYEGNAIASELGTTMAELFKKTYAEDLGRAKAMLLLRYGIQMSTPNPQNMLIELDENYKPTGKILFRDISDTRLIEPIAKHLAPEVRAALEIDQKAGFPIDQKIYPFWSNSSWRLDEAGIPKKVVADWGESHDRSFAKTILEELGLEDKLNINDFATSKTIPGKRGASPLIEAMDELLQSDHGLKVLSQYHRHTAVRGTGDACLQILRIIINR
jgi:hypothetical protein